MVPGFIRLTLFLSLLLFSLPNLYALPLPRLQVGFSPSNRAATLKVNLKKLAREVSLEKSTLLVERAHSNSKFKVLAVVRRPRDQASFMDPLNANQGNYAYRAKVIVRGRKQRNRVVKSSVVNVSLTTTVPSTVPDSGSNPQLSWPALDAGQSECPNDHPQLALQRINYHRALSGLPALESLEILTVAARLHTIKMAREQNLSHDGWFQSLWDLGFRGPHMAQNVANYIFDPNQVVDALMTSPGHMANILSPKDLHIGIACLVDQNGKIWWAMNHGT